MFLSYRLSVTYVYCLNRIEIKIEFNSFVPFQCDFHFYLTHSEPALSTSQIVIKRNDSDSKNNEIIH